ncbi:hypothetical protein [Legionella longbeachae]|uniref:hypothetical protein n=1 Tax=Legionella longbeachae TaxID=450 RepID=UPI00399CB712
MSLLEENANHHANFLEQQRIEKALEEYLKKGTPANYINSLDISNEEKANIYDKACLRKKGRLPKKNPYRD